MLIKFISKNSKTLIKYLVNHITMSFLGLFLVLPTTVLAEKYPAHKTLLIDLASAVAIFLYLFILHDLFWQLGAKNSIAQKGKGEIPDPFYGLKLSFTAYSPILLLIVICCASYAFSATSGVAADVSAVLIVILNFGLNAMFMGIYQMHFLPAPYIFLAFAAVSVLFPAFSYYLGTREFKLRTIIGLGNLEFGNKNK